MPASAIVPYVDLLHMSHVSTISIYLLEATPHVIVVRLQSRNDAVINRDHNKSFLFPSYVTAGPQPVLAVPSALRLAGKVSAMAWIASAFCEVKANREMVVGIESSFSA
jgi:hypothetical protein